MHIAFISQNYYGHYKDPNDFLEDRFTLRERVTALRNNGINVSVFIRFRLNYSFIKEGIQYYFIKGSLLSPPTTKPNHILFSFYWKVSSLLRTNSIDLIHTHDLGAISSNILLTRLFKQVPVLIQDHGSVLKPEQSVKFWFRRKLLKYSLSKADVLMFASPGQEEFWVKEKVIDVKKCAFVMENSSIFSPSDKMESRKMTGLVGDPVFIWVGHLNKNKDPFTVLTAFKEIFPKYPKAKLYMVYRESPLEDKVRKIIQQSDLLRNRVSLLGKKERTTLGRYYSSSDYIISASHKEGSGYAVIEAMSCGVIPILTDIPSFLDLTNHGEVGANFPVGDSKKLVETVSHLLKKEKEKESERVLTFFNANFSSDQIARKAIEVYSHCIAKF